MLRSQNFFFYKFGLALVMTPLLVQGNSGGPPAGRTGAPGDGTCANLGCHTGTGNPFTTGIELNFGAGGANYTPGGARQTWTLSGPSATVYGFQITARLASDERLTAAGTFTPITGQAVLCGDGGERPAAGCRASTPIEFLQHDGSPFRSLPITIQWTPPATNLGDVRIFVALNSANGNGSNSGDRITIANFTLKPAAQSTGPAIRADQPVLQAFSDKAAVSSGTWLQIFGSNFTTVTREWVLAGTKAPTSLEGVRVKVAGKDAFVSYISPGQINVQAPDDIGTGDGIAVDVTNANGSSTTRVTASKVSPALLTTPSFLVGGRQYVAAVFPDTVLTFVGRANLIAGVPFRPAKPGDTIIIYAVGCGATRPASPAGEVAPVPLPLATPITVRFGETTASAQAFVGGIGLCQFNVIVPNVAVGDIAIDATVDGVANGQNLFTTIGN